MTPEFAIQTWLMATQNEGIFLVNDEEYKLNFQPIDSGWVVGNDDYEVCWIFVRDDGFAFCESGKPEVRVESLKHLLKLFEKAFQELQY